MHGKLSVDILFISLSSTTSFLINCVRGTGDMQRSPLLCEFNDFLFSGSLVLKGIAIFMLRFQNNLRRTLPSHAGG